MESEAKKRIEGDPLDAGGNEGNWRRGSIEEGGTYLAFRLRGKQMNLCNRRVACFLSWKDLPDSGLLPRTFW